MSFSPELVITLLGYVREAVKFVDAIKDAPREMADLHDRMKFLAAYLGTLRTTLERRRPQLGLLGREQHEILSGIMDGLGADVRAVRVLYGEWRGNKGPWGLEWRFEIAAKVWHELGPRKGEIAALGESIDKRRRDLGDALQLMGFDGVYEVLDVVSGAKASSSPRRLTPEPAPLAKQPAPPAALKPNYRIIFVDPYNEGRSLVAEAMAKMLREWTRQTNGDWRIWPVHSAGLYLRAQSDPEIERLMAGAHIPAHKSMAWRPGGRPPNPLALQAMFDPAMCRPQVRSAVHPIIAPRRSRGVTARIFSTYDYIVVFHWREYDNLLALKRAMLRAAPTDRAGVVAPDGMGRIVHIGVPSLSGSVANVLDVDRDTPEARKPQRWREKVSEIRGLTQEFLTRRVGWQPPDAPAK